jgi:hypothetical protein
MFRFFRQRTFAGAAVLLTVLVGAQSVDAHEIVGQVTPLMIHMKRALLLIDNGKGKDALAEVRAVYDDFSHDMGMGMTMEGAGLKSTAAQIDRAFGTQLGASLEQSIRKEDADGLHRLIQQLAFLLMLEKFDAVQATFGKAPAPLDTQRTIFWLGRNYFSYLLEPTLSTTDPVEEQRLDRMLDVMLYRLEDGEHRGFVTVRADLVSGITKAFDLAIPHVAPTGLAQP